MAKDPKAATDGKPTSSSEAAGSQTTFEGQPQGQSQGQQSQAPQLAVLSQFIRDLSFESPNAPKSLQSPGANPKLELNVNVEATKRGDDVFEVALHFEGRGASDDGVIYNIELVYAGLFRLANIPEAAMQGVLFVDCPTLLFPFLRRIVAELSQEGGFPPLMLNPIDFAALYRRNAQQQQQQAQGAAPLKN